jgi:hypothetical protein
MRSFLVRTQHDNGRLVLHGAQSRDHLEAVEFRHPEIQDEHVGTMLDTQMDGVEPIGGFRNNRYAGDFQKPAHPPPHDGVIVSHKHTHDYLLAAARRRGST